MILSFLRNIHKEGLNKHLVADVSEVHALTCPVPKVKKAPSPPPPVLPNFKVEIFYLNTIEQLFQLVEQ